MDCGWIMDGLWMDYGQIVDGLWMDYGWIVDGLWMDCGWIMDGLWMDCGWIMDGLWMDEPKKRERILKNVGPINSEPCFGYLWVLSSSAMALHG